MARRRKPKATLPSREAHVTEPDDDVLIENDDKLTAKSEVSAPEATTPETAWGDETAQEMAAAEWESPAGSAREEAQEFVEEASEEVQEFAEKASEEAQEFAEETAEEAKELAEEATADLAEALEPESGLPAAAEQEPEEETVPLLAAEEEVEMPGEPEAVAEEAEPTLEAEAAAPANATAASHAAQLASIAAAAGAAPVTAREKARVPEEARAEVKERKGTALWAWFLGAVLLGAALGVGITLLVLSGINGSLSFATATDGLRLTREQAQLGQRVQELNATLESVQQQLTALSVLPKQVDGLQSELGTARQTINDLSQELQGLDGELSALSGNVDAAAAKLDTLGATVDELQPAVETLGQQVNEISQQVEQVRSATEVFQKFLDGLRQLLTP